MVEGEVDWPAGKGAPAQVRNPDPDSQKTYYGIFWSIPRLLKPGSKTRGFVAGIGPRPNASPPAAETAVVGVETGARLRPSLAVPDLARGGRGASAPTRQPHFSRPDRSNLKHLPGKFLRAGVTCLCPSHARSRDTRDGHSSMPQEAFKYRRARLRWLIVMIVVLAVMPVFALYLLRLQTSSENALAEAHERAATLARDGANAHAQIGQQARLLLEVASQVPAVRDIGPECDRFLEWVHGGRHWLAAIFVVGPSGKAQCGSVENSRLLDVSDRNYFLEAVRTGKFVMSDALIGRLTKRSIVVAALPIFEANGKLRSVLISGVDLYWINQVAAEASARYGGTLVAIDRNSRIIASQPNIPNSWKVGEIHDSPLVRTILNSPSPTFEAMDPLGERRIYGIARLDNGGVTIAVGLKRSDVLDPIDRAFRMDFLFLVLVAAGSIGAALALAEFGLLRGVRALKSAALRLKAGKMGLRVKLPAFVAAELHDLAANYNAMTAEFERLAYLDRLTGLPNRRYLERYLSGFDDAGEAVGEKPRAVLAIDLDGFKPVNDSYGHAIGDRVLTAIARRIAAVVDERGMLARVGGDEFVVILPLGSGNGREAARAFGEKIRAAMERPVEIECMALPVGCSIGIALVPEDAHSLGGALAIADAALYEAKRAGRNRVIDSAPPLASEALAESEFRKPHWMKQELTGLW